MSLPVHLRRKRIWSVADFAEFLGCSPKVARTRLETFDREMSGMLLTRGRGRTGYTFSPSQLARAFPRIFDSLENIEARISEAEDLIGELRASQRIIVSSVAQNTRDIARLRSVRRSAA